MARSITLRTLMLLLTLGAGLFVLVVTIRGVPGGLSAFGIDLAQPEANDLLRSVAATQFVRGIIAIILALLVVWVVAESATRLFSAKFDTGARPAHRWLAEAQDVADRFERTEKEQAWRSATIARQRAELERLIEAVSEGILHIDSAGRILRANRAARRLLALPDDIEGRQLASVVRSAELRALLQASARDQGLPPHEVVFEDRTLVVTARAMPVSTSGQSDTGAGLAVALADLTALRRLESVRRDFVANASHELKTPLTSIRGYAETLLDDQLPPETRKQFVATIASNAQRLQGIVDDLLDLSRLESGHWQPRLEPLSPGAIAAETWSDFADRARERAVSFARDVEIDDDVVADASALRQIFVNLYDNALRYTDRGGTIRCRIADFTAQARETGMRDRRARFAAIEVIDTGAGIPGDALPRIFERFYRVDPARSRAEGGTGLGLAIVRHLAESMGGRVEAESELGRGTTVRVVLPLVPLDADAEGSTSPARRGAPGPTSA